MTCSAYLQQLSHQVSCHCWKVCWEHEAALHYLLVSVGDVLIKEGGKAAAPLQLEGVHAA